MVPVPGEAIRDMARSIVDTAQTAENTRYGKKNAKLRRKRAAFAVRRRGKGVPLHARLGTVTEIDSGIRRMHTTLCMMAAACTLSLSPELGEISYRISIEPTADRTNLHVVMSFVGDASGVTRLQLPSDRYGTQKIWESISHLATSGAEIRPVKDRASLRDHRVWRRHACL